MKFYVDERTGKVHILPPVMHTHDECVRKMKAKKARKIQKAARRRNRSKQ